MLASANGATPPGGDTVCFSALTDALIVSASDALQEAVDAWALPKPSGKAQARCLAWLLAALVGSQARLDEAEAGRAGKRLTKQAGRVRAAVADASFAAQQQRQLARAAAAADALLADELPELARRDRRS